MNLLFFIKIRLSQMNVILILKRILLFIETECEIERNTTVLIYSLVSKLEPSLQLSYIPVLYKNGFLFLNQFI